MYKNNFSYKISMPSEWGGQKVLLYFIVLVSVLMAMLLGLIAVTGNPIIISIAVAFVASAVLLIRVDWIVWLILSLGLLVTGLLPLFFDYFASKAAWGVSLLGFSLMLIALVKIVMTPDARRNTPAFVWIALVFIAYALINSLVQWHSFGETVGGFKRYFQVWGLIFALCWVAFDKQQIRYWRLLFLFVALVQLPFAIYERVIYVPIREGLKNSYPGMVPIDVVSGTFGATLTGGGASGEMAIFLVIILAFLLARQKEKVLSSNKFLLLTPIIIAPLLLTEVKAVIVMIPLMFLVLYRNEMLIQFHRWLIGFVAISTFVVVAGYAYLFAMSQDKEKSMTEYIEQTLEHNLYDKGHFGGNSLNRTTVLPFWLEKQGLHDPASFVFGNGLGSSHLVAGGHMAMRYFGYGIGLTAASTLLWDVGLLGIGLFFVILILAWRCAAQLRRESAIAEVRADAAAIQTALVLFVFYLFYRLGMLEILSFQIPFAALLGYLAWLHCEHTCAITNK
ncbi:MAG: hypothetical protein JSR32_05690 [Proteobacteria bacterium]|nr:hypothetical protein [Pseudomonadota bacterium]